MTGDDRLPRPTEGGIGLVGDSRGLVKEYEDFLGSVAPPLRGLKIVLDCANGATYRVAPSVFARAGAEVLTLFDQPDGANINLGCGATALEALATHDAMVYAHGNLKGLAAALIGLLTPIAALVAAPEAPEELGTGGVGQVIV